MNALMLLANTHTWEDLLTFGKEADVGWDERQLGILKSARFIASVVKGRWPTSAETTPDLGAAPDPEVLHVWHEDGGVWVAREGEDAVLVAKAAGDDDLACLAAQVGPAGPKGAANATAPAASVEDRVAAALSTRLSRLRRWFWDMDRETLGGREAPVDCGAMGEREVQSLLSTAFSLVGASLVLFDGSFSYYGYAGNESPMPPALAKTIELGYSVGATVEYQRTYRQMQLEHPEGFETHFDEEGGPTPVWACTVATRGGGSYQLHVMGPVGRDPGVRELTAELVVRLRALLERVESGRPATPHRDYVQELVLRRHSESEARSRARFFGWAPRERYRVARVESRDESFASARWEDAKLALLDRNPDVHGSVMDDGLAVIAFFDEGSEVAWAQGDARRRLEEYLRVEGLVTGLSDARRNLSDVPTAYDEACMAAGCVSPGVDRPQRMALYDDCKLQVLLEALGEASKRRNVVPNCLSRLRDHDAAHGTEYGRTLESYLRNALNKTAVCRDLSIHRSTLDYRLDRIRAHWGVDFEDPRLVEHLLMVFFLEDEHVE